MFQHAAEAFQRPVQYHADIALADARQRRNLAIVHPGGILEGDQVTLVAVSAAIIPAKASPTGAVAYAN